MRVSIGHGFLRRWTVWGLLLVLAGSIPCASAQETKKTKDKGTPMRIEKTPFGKTGDGQAVTLFTCTNELGLTLKLIDYGAIVVALETPDRNGRLANINLGFSKLDGYLERHPYFGATVGRYCNRIAKGKFSLNGQEYTLATNNGANHLHGGIKGFDKHIWQAAEVKTADSVGVKFTRRSPDGEEGYPANLDVAVVYSLTNRNELKVDFTASTDKPTVVNLTNHNYWNLSPHKIGERIKQIKADPVGYDHCFVLRSQNGELSVAARVKEPSTGRVMEILTTQPGIQFYSGNFLDGSAGNGGYQQYEGFCLETQHYPDSPNQPKFPSTVLKPGDSFKQTTVHRFSVE
jgi:aldose 1-epimerase